MDQINAKEMEKIVREAGMYEENMSREEILTFYEAITNSKTTATTEDESREFNQSQIEEFEEIAPSEDEDNSIRNSIKDDESNDVELEILDACKANITFNDMQSMPKEKYLPVPYHTLKYVNIQNSKQFLEADTNIKAKMLYSYHTKTEKLRSDLSKQSFFTVPLPKPIIIRDMQISQAPFDSDDVYTYISRSGRQTKRKLYNEDEDSNPGMLTTKKQKNVEIEWTSKLKPLLKGSASKGYDVLPEATKTHNSNNSQIMATTPKSTANRTKKFTNTEIMEKSKLFEDLPPKVGTPTSTKATEIFLKTIPKSKRLTRSEEMFEKMVRDTEKNQQEKNALEAFEESLEVSDEETFKKNEPEGEDVINIMDDEPARRRIVPPIPPLKRRTIHSTSNSAGPLNETAESSKKDNCLSKKKRKPKNESSKPSGYADSKNNDDESDVSCPMCNNNFPMNKIQAHAATCGEEETVSKYQTRRNLLCNICDKVFVSNYEEHVKSCISRYQDKI